MALNDKKISALPSLAPAIPDSPDLFAIVDWDTITTKKITVQELFANPQPIGTGIPKSGRFTTLKFTVGQIINEFSTDGTLAGNSDDALPTEKAVKTYVDNAALAGTSGTSGSSGTSGATGTSGSSGTSGISAIVGAFVHTQSVDSTCWTVIHNLGVKYVNVEVVRSDGYSWSGHYNYPTIEFIDTTSLQICFNEDQTGWASVTSGGGIAGSSGSSGNSGTSGSSGTSGVGTSGTSGSSGISVINARYISSDSTAVAGDVILVDTTSGDVTIELIGTPKGRIIVKKITGDSNKVILVPNIGTIDGGPQYNFDDYNETIDMVTDTTAFYIV